LLNVVEVTGATGQKNMVKRRDIWLLWCYKWENQKNQGCLPSRAVL